MHPKLLIEVAIAGPLTFLFNKTLKDGTLPVDWKKAFYLKKGLEKLAGNYRPISVTSILCKLQEKFVKKAILEYFCNITEYVFRDVFNNCQLPTSLPPNYISKHF